MVLKPHNISLAVQLLIPRTMKLPAALVALSFQIAQGRCLQTADAPPTYTPEECVLWFNLVVSTFDADESGGLSSDEYFEVLSYLGPATTATSYAEMDLNAKLSFTTMACSCVSLGLGEDCCAGKDAEIPVSVSSTADDPAVEAYLANVCNVLATGMVNVSMPSSVGAVTKPTTAISFTEPTVSAGVPSDGGALLGTNDAMAAASEESEPTTTVAPDPAVIVTAATVEGPVESEKSGLSNVTLVFIILGLVIIPSAIVAAFTKYRKTKDVRPRQASLSIKAGDDEWYEPVENQKSLAASDAIVAAVMSGEVSE
jgi:hypothetical protein